MAYSDSYSFGTGPTMGSYFKPQPYGSDYRTPTQFQYVIRGKQDKKAANAFDAIMAGHDASSAAYVSQLKALYDGYGQYAKDYGTKAQPIIDALTGDIKGLENYRGDYEKTLAGIKDNMLNGINLDPNSTNTRERYQGNVAAANAQVAEQQKQQMQSQGLNPYANTGASRATSLAGAASLADAGNKAYADWHTQYNTDVQAKQAGQATYAGLQSKLGDMQNNIMAGRGNVLNANKSIYDANMGSDQAKATGYEGLASLAEARRAETLKLGQQKENNARMDNDIKQQQYAKLKPNELTNQTNMDFLNDMGWNFGW
jgi:hypothetical protein